MTAAAPPLSDATAVVLAGGRGTRLRSVLPDRPKVLAEVCGRPFIAHLLDRLVAAGVRSAALCTGWRGEDVRAALGESHGPLRLMYSPEKSPLGTGGALRLALPLIASDSALVFNGDTLCLADLAAAWARHHETGAQATIVLVRTPDAARYGRVVAGASDEVMRFEEKGASGPGWINGGVYVIRRSLVQAIPARRAVSLEREVFPGWVGRGLKGFPCEARFLDIGTPEALAAAQEFLHEA